MDLFEAVPLPFRYCRVPGPDEDDVVRKNKRTYFVNQVMSTLTKEAFRHAGFKQTKTKKWNVSWGRQFDNDEFSACKAWQKVNHFCGAWLIGRKDQLHKRLTGLQKKLGDSVDFYPESYLLPGERESLKRAWKKVPLWIAKPVANSNGRGIKVIASKESPPPVKDGLIVQRYVMNPFLITGRKFDMRLYVLVTSLCPLRIYIHESGLARFATHEYDTGKSPSDLHMHLTNYSVNKKDESFVAANEGESVQNSKWSLKFLLHYLDTIGVNSKDVMKDVERAVVMTFLAGMTEVKGFHNRYVLHRHTSCELYGVDVLLDSNLKPHIIEVNISPSLVANDSKLDWNLKYPLVLDVLRMARIVNCSAKKEDPCPALVLIDRNYRLSMANGRKSSVESGTEDPWKQPVFADFVMIRDFLEEKSRLGGFHRIFPTRKTMNDYTRCFDSMRYDDIVLSRWIAMDDQQRVAVLRKHFQTYIDGMSEVTSKLRPTSVQKRKPR